MRLARRHHAKRRREAAITTDARRARCSLFGHYDWSFHPASSGWPTTATPGGVGCCNNILLYLWRCHADFRLLLSWFLLYFYKSPLPLTDRATQCLAPTVLYTYVDDQFDKLVTDDDHRFSTPTVHLSWQHLRLSAVPEIWLVPTKI